MLVLPLLSLLFIGYVYGECGWFVQDNNIAPLGYCYQISNSDGSKESYIYECINNKRWLSFYDELDCLEDNYARNETGIDWDCNDDEYCKCVTESTCEDDGMLLEFTTYDSSSCSDSVYTTGAYVLNQCFPRNGGTSSQKIDCEKDTYLVATDSSSSTCSNIGDFEDVTPYTDECIKYKCKSTANYYTIYCLNFMLILVLYYII